MVRVVQCVVDGRDDRLMTEGEKQKILSVVHHKVDCRAKVYGCYERSKKFGLKLK